MQIKSTSYKNRYFWILSGLISADKVCLIWCRLSIKVLCWCNKDSIFRLLMIYTIVQSYFMILLFGPDSLQGVLIFKSFIYEKNLSNFGYLYTTLNHILGLNSGLIVHTLLNESPNNIQEGCLSLKSRVHVLNFHVSRITLPENTLSRITLRPLQDPLYS